MNKEKFKNHLNDSAKLLLALTGQFCFNELAENCVFTITPNVRLPDAHLNEQEILLLKTINKQNGRHYTANEVVGLLWQEDKVPLWINTSVYSSESGITVVNLNCSRRLRSESELNHTIDQYPPFHPTVVQPPDFLRTGNGKYDINWNKRFDEIIKPKGVWAKMKRFVSDDHKEPFPVNNS